MRKDWRDRQSQRRRRKGHRVWQKDRDDLVVAAPDGEFNAEVLDALCDVLDVELGELLERRERDAGRSRGEALKGNLA